MAASAPKCFSTRVREHGSGQRGGRDIDIDDRNVQERVADRAADHARFLAVTGSTARARGRLGRI